MFIKLLIVRGSFSASFPVIAVIVSPTFIKRTTRRYPSSYSEKKTQRVFSKVENTGVDQRKKRRGAGMDPVAVSKYPAEDEQRRVSPPV